MIFAVRKSDGVEFVMTMFQGQARFTKVPLLPYRTSNPSGLINRILSGKIPAFVQGESMNVQAFDIRFS